MLPRGSGRSFQRWDADDQSSSSGSGKRGKESKGFAGRGDKDAGRGGRKGGKNGKGIAAALSRSGGGLAGLVGRGRRGEAKNRVEELSAQQVQQQWRRQVPRVRDTLEQLRRKDMLPAIWFIFSRRGCDTAVSFVRDTNLLSPSEQAEVTEAIAALRQQQPEAVREGAVEALKKGVAAHHAGCLPPWKGFVEDLFQRGLVKVVFATETLSAGINMPARTTVLSALSKHLGGGNAGRSLLSANALLQMAGRAGRRGKDKQGHVVVVQTPFEGAQDCCRLLLGGADPLVSQFTATYGMALNLLGGAPVWQEKTEAGSGAGPEGGDSGEGDATSNGATGEPPAAAAAGEEGQAADASAAAAALVPVRRGRSMEEAKALIERSFGNYLASEVLQQARQQLATLEEKLQQLRQRKEEVERQMRSEEEGSDEVTGAFRAMVGEFVSTRHTVATLQRQVFQQRAFALDPQIQDALLWADEPQEAHAAHEAPVAAAAVAAATDGAAASDDLPAVETSAAAGGMNGAPHFTGPGGNGAARPAPAPVGRRLVVTAQFPDLASGAVRSVRGLLVGQLEALPPYLQEEGEDWAEEGGVGEEEGGDMGRVAKGRVVKGKGDGKRSLRNSGRGGEGGERGREQEEEEEEGREAQGLKKLIRAQYDPTDQSELAMSAADGRQLVGRYLWPDGRQDEADETAGWQRAAKLKLFLPPVPEMLQGWLRGSGGEKGERTEVGGGEEESGRGKWGENGNEGVIGHMGDQDLGAAGDSLPTSTTESESQFASWLSTPHPTFSVWRIKSKTPLLHLTSAIRFPQGWSPISPFSPSEDSNHLTLPSSLSSLEASLKSHKQKLSQIRKRVKASAVYKRRQQLVTEMGRCEYEEGKVGRRVEALRRRIAGMQPAGWQEFVQVVQVLAQADALDPQSSTLMPLGEIAAKVRGVNELWIAVALSHPSLPRLSPPAIAGCCAALVSEGMRMRTGDGSSPSFPYEPSWEVQEWVYEAEERRDWLLQLQLAANVAIPADLDAQFAGVVEAWAQGVTWRQLISDCAGLDEGDIARLLRRTIDILSQIPYLPGIDPSLAKAAKQSAYVMERPPISELIG
ncbi:unnamed protein product [Closterium sp. NIES-53]